MKYDQFYTKKEISIKCIKIAKKYFSEFDIILEPSAGNGSFFLYLPKRKRYGIDIDPKIPEIKKMNFFDFIPIKDKKYLVIGNPPFGKVSSNAIKFFNKSATFADMICFILPRTFRRSSIQNKLDLRYHLIHDIDIPIGSFIPESMKAKCCFQIWKKYNYKRKKILLPTKHKDFNFLSIKNKEYLLADFAIKAYGSNCGEVSFDVKSLSPKSWHFIKSNINLNILLKNISKIDFSISQNTSRQDSIGRGDFIMLYNKLLKNQKIQTKDNKDKLDLFFN